ncbi:MAG: HEPN domain-containing protein [Candidatus Electrothrix sp. ATG2]|nr:HEPN domain-containing protein [Candidatus Electrothrix sp. ATG2]
MTPEERQTIITYRLERAEESLRAALLMYENSMLIPAMNRIYYTMFYAVQALLARDEVGFSKHGQGSKAILIASISKPAFFLWSPGGCTIWSLNTGRNLIMLIW